MVDSEEELLQYAAVQMGVDGVDVEGKEVFRTGKP